MKEKFRFKKYQIFMKKVLTAEKKIKFIKTVFYETS